MYERFTPYGSLFSIKFKFKHLFGFRTFGDSNLSNLCTLLLYSSPSTMGSIMVGDICDWLHRHFTLPRGRRITNHFWEENSFNWRSDV